ncbi:MAG: SCO family protein [Thermoanaerobaculia bacterium]|nr:SCO family protein [Thermoanaerobaculia bacterium]
MSLRGKRGGARRPLGLAALAAIAVLTAPATAQKISGPRLLDQVGFDQRLGEAVSLDLPFTDRQGREVELGRYFGERPVLLIPVYFTCPVLCSTVTERVAAGLSVLDFAPGSDYEVVLVSFDPADDAAGARETYERFLGRYGEPVAGGLHVVTGSDSAVAQLTREIGFRYAWDEDMQQFLHGGGLVVLTPDGTISSYLFGLEYSPRDLRLGVVEASAGTIGSVVDQVLLYCFRYDPGVGRYSAATLNLVRLGGALTVAAMVALFVALRRRERAEVGHVA